MDGTLELTPVEGPEAERQSMLEMLERVRLQVVAGDVKGLVCAMACGGYMGRGEAYTTAFEIAGLYEHEAAWVIALVRLTLLLDVS